MIVKLGTSFIGQKSCNIRPVAVSGSYTAVFEIFCDVIVSRLNTAYDLQCMFLSSPQIHAKQVLRP